MWRYGLQTLGDASDICRREDGHLKRNVTMRYQDTSLPMVSFFETDNKQEDRVK